MNTNILEYFIRSKSGLKEKCEDAIHIGSDFIAVIDGATDKSKIIWKHGSRGQTISQLIDESLGKLCIEATATEAVAHINEAVKYVYRTNKIEERVKTHTTERLTASVAIYSKYRREIWMIGDCQARFGGSNFYNKKRIDELISYARSVRLELLLADGRTEEELRGPDPGREFILPLLREQTKLQNNPSAGYLWYAVIDGFAFPESGIKVIPVPSDIEEIILATDGYPFIEDTLKDSEEALKKTLRDDPLLIRNFRTTKCPSGPDESFDDRAFVRFKCNE